MAGIIKADGLNSGARNAIPTAFHLADIKQRVDATLGQAESQAATIIKQATDQADQVTQNAAQQGQQAAAQAAQQSADQALDQKLLTLMPALEQVVQGILQSKDAWQKNWETNAVRLAIAIAARIVRREVAQTPEITIDLVREAIELAAGSGQITVFLNPLDHATLGQRAQQIVNRLSNLAKSDVIPDNQVSPGGCVIKTEFGEIDQQLESQLSRIEAELNGD